MIASESVNERRDLFRMGIECPVAISGMADEREVEGRLLDLSGSGLAIECSETFSEGDTFRIKVEPDKPIFLPLVADVEVVRVDEGSGGKRLYGLKICQLIS